MLEIRVANRTDPEKLGGAIATLIRKGASVKVISVGILAENNISDALNVASRYVQKNGIKIKSTRNLVKNQLLDAGNTADIVYYIVERDNDGTSTINTQSANSTE